VKLGEALEAILPRLGDALAVHANGFISRVAHALRDRAENFYMIGSMGLASSIGLGLALARPERRVVVLDGDGNVLTNLGGLAMIGALKPANLLHVCLDNAAYGSTGNQRTISAQVPLENVARAAGYAEARRVACREELESIFPQWLQAAGPRFLLVRIEPGVDEASLPRVGHEPTALAHRFRAAATSGP